VDAGRGRGAEEVWTRDGAEPPRCGHGVGRGAATAELLHRALERGSRRASGLRKTKTASCRKLTTLCELRPCSTMGAGMRERAEDFCII
jgi:hypothetical protein